MACCDLLDTCYFYRNELADMPCTYKHLMNKYCNGNYAQCARFAYARANGRSNVPLEMFPNDGSKTLEFNVLEPERGVAMLIKVIYADGSTGMVRTSRLAKLVKMNRIAAYESFDRWVEIRRRHADPVYQGPERRKQGYA